MKKLLSIISFILLALSLSAQNENAFLKINGSEEGFYTDISCRDTVITVNVESSEAYSVYTTTEWCKVENQTPSSFDLAIGFNESGKLRDCIIRVSNSEKMAPIALSQDRAPYLHVNGYSDAMTYEIDVKPVTISLNIDSTFPCQILNAPKWIKAEKTDAGYDLMVDASKKKVREATLIIASGDFQVPVTVIQKEAPRRSPSFFVKVMSLLVFCGWGVFAVMAP